MMNYKLLTIPLMLLCAACGKEKKASELNETSVSMSKTENRCEKDRNWPNWNRFG